MTCSAPSTSTVVAPATTSSGVQVMGSPSGDTPRFASTRTMSGSSKARMAVARITSRRTCAASACVLARMCARSKKSASPGNSCTSPCAELPEMAMADSSWGCSTRRTWGTNRRRRSRSSRSKSSMATRLPNTPAALSASSPASPSATASIHCVAAASSSSTPSRSAAAARPSCCSPIRPSVGRLAGAVARTAGSVAPCSRPGRRARPCQRPSPSGSDRSARSR